MLELTGHVINIRLCKGTEYCAVHDDDGGVTQIGRSATQRAA